jgi:hypothetical protein
MAKIELSITADYLPDWGLAEGVRELVQNARDAEVQYDARMTVRHDNGSKLIIENEGVELPHEALLFGATTKAGRDDLIGQFGEGLKLGVLALVRAGFSVKIRSGGEVWVPEIIRSEKFSRARILAFDIRKGNEPKRRVRVEVGGLSNQGWEGLKPTFLFLQKLPPSHHVETSAGTLLLDARHAGQVYVKGIRVAYREDLRYGYNLAHAKLDRDRRMIDESDLKCETSRIWQEALDRRPDLLEPLYQVLQEGTAVDAGHASWYLSDQHQRSLATKFTLQFGARAIPVETSGDSMEVEHLGRRGIVTPKALRDTLRSTFGTVDTLKAGLAKEAIRVWSWAELTMHEQYNLGNAVRILKGISTLREESVDVVDFRSETLQGLFDGTSGKIRLARTVLSDEADVLATLVHEVAHRSSSAGDGTKDHVRAIEQLWAEIYRHVTQRSVAA